MVLTFISKYFFLSLFGFGFEYVGKTKFTGVLCEDLWAGTHIIINYQPSDGIKHFKKLFWNPESRCITDVQ